MAPPQTNARVGGAGAVVRLPASVHELVAQPENVRQPVGLPRDGDVPLRRGARPGALQSRSRPMLHW